MAIPTPPDGNGGWIPGAHEPVLDDTLFARAQTARRANDTGAAKVRRGHRRYSLTGLAVCGHCGGRLHFNTASNGGARYYCYQGRQVTRCPQRSGPVARIDEQIRAYLGSFTLPEEVVQQLVALYEQAASQRDDLARRRRQVTDRLGRIKELYGWGDLTREAYQAERDHLHGELASLRESTDQAAVLAQTAAYLRDLPAAWTAASPAERNGLARAVFQTVEITDDRVTAVIPTADFAPFFNLVVANTETGPTTKAAPDFNLMF